MEKRVLFLCLCLAAMPGRAVSAGEEQAPVQTIPTEVEAETTSDNSSTYFRAAMMTLGKENKPGLTVSVRGLRLKEKHGFEHQGFLGAGVRIPVVKGHLEIAPGLAFMVSDKNRRGIGPNLEVSGQLGKASVRAILDRTYSFRDEAGFLRLYPLWGEYRLTKRISPVFVFEAERLHGKIETEKGAGLSIRHFHGTWYAYWLTGVSEADGEGHEEIRPLLHQRHHIVRFGRSFEIGGRHE